MAVWTGYTKNGPGNYMDGNTTKTSHQMFKVMLEAFGTDQSRFQQPSDVYRVNNELFIKGANPEEAPPVTKNNKEKPFDIGGNKEDKKIN